MTLFLRQLLPTQEVIDTKKFDIFCLWAVPSVRIVGEREVHVKSGTSVFLSCLISNVLQVPSYVFWYKGHKRLIDDKEFSISTRGTLKDGIAVSVLTIQTPKPQHSGVFSCKPNDLDQASVDLHVIQGNFDIHWRNCFNHRSLLSNFYCWHCILVLYRDQTKVSELNGSLSYSVEFYAVPSEREQGKVVAMRGIVRLTMVRFICVEVFHQYNSHR